jgi:LPS O-antigen subunit length determinant protein (WzzB/FepE family)
MTTEHNNKQPIYLSPEMFQQQGNSDDEIDLRELFITVWQGKWVIVLFTLLFSVAAVFYAINQPNYYKAQVLLSPTSGEGGGGLGQLGGLAALAGVNIGGKTGDKTQLAIAVLKSRDFQSTFVNKYQIKPFVFAGNGWNENTGELTLNSDIYNAATKKWTREVDEGKSSEPTDWELYKEFSKIVSTSEDKDTGLVTVTAEFLSPILAKEWLELLISDLNQVMKDKELQETSRNITYLRQQLTTTSIADMQSVFYQLIEDQIKNKMLAEVQDEFVFKIVDPAVIPEEKSKPKRALICILGFMLGGMLGVAFVLIRTFFKKDK